MRSLVPFAVFAVACWGQDAYILQGTVVEKTSATEVVVAHDEIAGFMPAMTMPFTVRDPAMLAEVEPGDRIYARLMVEEDGSYLARVRVTGHGPVPSVEPSKPIVDPMTPGDRLPAIEIPLHDGSTWSVGAGQGRPTVLSYVYTRCPIPEFCPATIAKMQALQSALLAAEKPEEGPRIVLVTLDPAYDTAEVLATYATTAAADPRVWRMGRVEVDVLADLALRSAMVYGPNGTEIAHALRVLVLDADGRLVARHDDLEWAPEVVLAELAATP